MFLKKRGLNNSIRGQITLFVILGLILLVGIIGVIYIVSNSKQGFEEPKIEQLPEDFAPVRDMVDQCLELTLMDSLKQIGMRGGYIDPNDEELSKKEMIEDLNKYKYTELVRFNKNDEESTIPLWIYLGSSNTCNNCVLSSLSPSKEELEEQIKTYILMHLNECINYGDLRDISITPGNEQEVNVKLFNDSISVSYKRKLTMKIGDRTKKVDSFFINPKMPFLKMYNTALEITAKEFSTDFLENYISYMISAYSGLESNLPPVAAHTQGFDYKVWVLPTVQNQLNTVLRTYTPTLRVKNTKNDLEISSDPSTNQRTPTSTTSSTTSTSQLDPYLRGFLNITRLDLFNDSVIDELGIKNYSISFIYPGSSFLDISPKQGMLLKPRIEKTSGVLFLPPKQDNYYNFFYDVSAPFIIVIHQDNFTPGNSVEFIFALEANILKNKNIQELMMGRGIIPWSYDYISVSVDDPTKGLDALAQCGSIDDDTLKQACLDADFSETSDDDGINEYKRNESVPSIFCREEAKSVPVKIQTFEAGSNNGNTPLRGVSISYKCGFYGTCNLGISLNDSNNVYAGYYGKMPICQGGLLKFEKQGYNTKTVEFSTIGTNFRNNQISVYLEKIYKKTVNVSVKELSKNEDSQFGSNAYSISGGRALKDNEEVIITLTKTANDPSGSYEAPLSSTIIIDNESIHNDEDSNVSLIPGLYDVMITYLDNDGVIIPKECETIKGNKIPEEDIEIKPAPWGGLELNKNTFLFQVQRKDLQNNNTLYIPVFRFPNPECLDDLEDMGNIKKFVRKFKKEAKPEFK